MDLSGIVAAAADDAGFDTSDDNAIEDTSGNADTPDEGTDDDTASPETRDDTSAEPGDDSDAEGEPAKKDATPSEEDELKAIEAELTGKNPALKKGKIPVSRHQAVLDRARRKYETELKAATDKYAEYDNPTTKQQLEAIRLAETNPEMFTRNLTALPQYKTIIDRIVAERVAQSQPAKADPPPADDTRPEPNYMFADGSLGYDAAGQQKLFEWQERQLKKSFDAELTAKTTEIKQQIEPFVRERAARERTEQIVQQVSPVLNSARRWTGFTEHEADIQAEINKPQYEGLSAQQALERAYDAVVPGKLKLAEEQKLATLKADWVKEMNAKSKARGVPTPGGVPAAAGTETRSIFDIVRDTAASLDE